MPNDGFWSAWGSPASVDWCEPNYAVSFYVTEWWNTLSSLAFAAAGVYGLYRLYHSGLSRWGRVAGCFLGLTAVGLGSTAFHGTLLRVPQALDELPMVWFGLIAAWSVAQRRQPPGHGRGLALALCLFGAGFTTAYLTSDSYFGPFLLTYGSVVTFITLRSGWVGWKPSEPALGKRWLVAACLGFCSGLFGAWVPEHVLLPCDHPLQALQLHSWWHILSGFGVYAWVTWLAIDRAPVEGQRAVAARGWLRGEPLHDEA